MAKQTTPKTPAVVNSAVGFENPSEKLLQLAMTSSDVDVEKLQQFMEMYERMEAQKAIKSYNAAMASLQGSLPTIPKDAKIVVRGELRSEYSKYETIMASIKPLLQKNGFAVSLSANTADGKVAVKCTILHKDGHKEENTVTLPLDESGAKNSVQKIGSSLSYAKRYALCLIANIPTGGEDDDGNKAGEAEPNTPPKKSALRVAGEKLAAALEIYQGEDEQDIRDLCKAKREAGEFDLKFAKEILKKVS